MGSRGERIDVPQAALRAGSQAVGAALGQILGVEAGAALGQALSDAGNKAVDFLRGRAASRAGRTLENVTEQIRDREARGESVRWQLKDDDAGAAIELFESMLDAAAKSAEERKCEVIANLMASVAFDLSVSTADGLLYLQRVRDASWRQLVILQYVIDPSRQDERQRMGVAMEEGDVRLKPAVEVEMFEAASGLELIGYIQEDGGVSNPLSTWRGTRKMAIEKLGPTELGESIGRMGRLDEVVSANDLEDFVNEMTIENRIS